MKPKMLKTTTKKIQKSNNFKPKKKIETFKNENGEPLIEA